MGTPPSSNEGKRKNRKKKTRNRHRHEHTCLLIPWIQNAIILRRNSHIEKVSGLAEPHFRRRMGCDCRIMAIFLCQRLKSQSQPKLRFEFLIDTLRSAKIMWMSVCHCHVLGKVFGSIATNITSNALTLAFVPALSPPLRSADTRQDG